VTTRESIGVGMLGYAFVRSAESGRREEITYRGIDG
jgi:hypothetical protein